MKSSYDFLWEHLGNLSEGRPNLGLETSVVVYRLMMFTFKDVLSKELGLEKTNELFFKTGMLAGKEFCQKMLNVNLPFAEFVADLKEKLISLKVGVLRLEKADDEKLQFTLTVAEDLECSGLPLFGETVCDYDEGFIAGILKEYTGKEFVVKEVDCWAMGDRICRFAAQPTVAVV